MAQLTLIVNIQTTEEYDEESARNQAERLAGREIPTTADELGAQVISVLGGLGYVESVTAVGITTTLSSASKPKSASCAVPMLAKKAG